VFVYRTEEDMRVYDSRCPHQVTDIPHLALEGKRLTCPKHHWAFDIEDGECVEVGNRPLRRFEHKVENGRLLAYW
jgi:nitrite reductase/ring-hydroxylating ferredoxin subunit